MRVVEFICAGALLAGAAGNAAAQAPATTQPVDAGEIHTTFTVSGFVGSNFGATGDSAAIEDHSSFAYGGQFAYLWKGIVGAEFLSEFAPSFKAESAVLPDNLHVATYMANAIASVPLGAGGQFQPYVSGGYGGMSLRAHILTNLAGNTTDNTQSVWGSNLGGGLMAFAGNWGVRADGRYYRAPTKTVTGSAADQLTERLLSGLGFWRTSLGIAYRW